MNRLTCALLLAALHLAPAHAVETLSNGQFEAMKVYRPGGEVRQVIYLLADPGMQDTALERIGNRLAAQSALVVRIDTAALQAGLQDPSRGCVDLGADFEGLSHFLQAHYRLPAYHPPYFVGVGTGAALAYALMAQAPTSTYAGVLSYDFCPELRVRTPLCRGDDLRTVRHVVDDSTELLPLRRSHTRWVVQPDGQEQQCDVRRTPAFLSRLPDSDLITIRAASRGVATEDSFMRGIMEALNQLQAQPQGQLSANQELSDLPLVEVLPANPVATFAVLLSGDGGWTGLDKDVAAALAARGVAVVGWDSLRYFWKARTPEGLAADAERVIAHYTRRWPGSRVLLLGYSQGANVLPFLVNRLSAEALSHIALVAMTALGSAADFEFHFANWVAASDASLPVLPELTKLGGPPALCIYGLGDDESACPAPGQTRVRTVALPGGHHFNGNYGALAKVILDAMDSH